DNPPPYCAWRGHLAARATLVLYPSSSWRKIAISNNVGGVKDDVRTRLHALVEERHFALVDGLRFPTLARF
ncbi:MAG TPA: hypothetical protein VK513_13760, partial [Terriglobales bacterium]|nr:hypothetical protein [Terriglobales bacterium]